jgi:hypothetical protein
VISDYEADVIAAEANRGKQIVRLICGGCPEGKRIKDTTVGAISDSPKGPFFEATVWEIPLLKDKDTTGRRQKPGRGLKQGLLDVPPDARRDGFGNYRLLNASCPRHEDLSIDEAVLLEAVSAFHEYGKVRTVRLDATPWTTRAQR